jgi:hypothetical protein
LRYDLRFKFEGDEFETRAHEFELLEIRRIMDDELTKIYLTYSINYKTDDPSKINDITEIKFTEQFRQLVGRINNF